MILVRFTGGLGNQMFQYALGLALAKKNNTQLKIDTTLLLDKSMPHDLVTHRKLDIDIFDIHLNYATEKEVIYFNGKKYSSFFGKIYNKILWQLRKNNLIIESRRDFIPKITELTDNKCLVGAWQSEKYFKAAEEEVRKEFTFKLPLPAEATELAKQIQATNSLCVHVRRGDYVTSPIYSLTIGALPKEYYPKSFAYLQSFEEIDQVFVFSDDLAWCRQNLKFPATTTFVDHEFKTPKFITDMQLMVLCKHFIISNSSFSWWAAWLSTTKGKKVIAPADWFKDKSMCSVDIVPENWIKL